MRPVFIALTLYTSLLAGAEFRSDFSSHDRVWIGPQYWANPLQDWRLHDGRVEAAASGGNRNLFLLTHELSGAVAPFEIRVRLGKLSLYPSGGWAGFRIGIKGVVKGYRYAALRGKGLNIGITTTGAPFIGDREAAAAMRRRDPGIPLDSLELRLVGTPDIISYRLTLTVHDASGKELLRAEREETSGAMIAGGVALVNEPMFEFRPSVQDSYGPEGKRTGDVRFWFDDWSMTGPKVTAHPERSRGPILSVRHSLSDGVMKVTARFPPLGKEDASVARLEVADAVGWKEVAAEPIDAASNRATFSVEDWDSGHDVRYRVAYEYEGHDRYRMGTAEAEAVD